MRPVEGILHSELEREIELACSGLGRLGVDAGPARGGGEAPYEVNCA